MKIHEFQAKKILSDYGIPVPEGAVAGTPEKAKEIASSLGGPVIVKAQVHSGGRGKAGGIKNASGPDAAFNAADFLLGSSLVTEQTGPGGQKIKQVLIEKDTEIVHEYFLGITIDRSKNCPVIMASCNGGVDIEETAQCNPDRIITTQVDPVTGLSGFHARKICFSLNMHKDIIKQVSSITGQLYKIFIKKDCSLIEINPLAVTCDKQLVALDSKITFDDDALFRHPDIEQLADPDFFNPLELEAKRHNLNYVKLAGSVGCMVNGAGLAMATMDIIKLAGLTPANFLDVGGSASARQVENGLRIILTDSSVKLVLINIFGGILRCDRVAEGIVRLAEKKGIGVPMIIRLEGTNARQAGETLKNSGINFQPASTFDDVLSRVATHARQCAAVYQ